MADKQVPMIESVHEAMIRLQAAKQQQCPQRHVTKREIVADLIMQADKRRARK